ncbi:MAG: hypothetical protein WCP96_07735, partial [Methylococcaceae bacterium]
MAQKTSQTDRQQADMSGQCFLIVFGFVVLRIREVAYSECQSYNEKKMNTNSSLFHSDSEHSLKNNWHPYVLY